MPDEFFIPEEQMDEWEYLKGAKSEERTAANGHDTSIQRAESRSPIRTDAPSRTILTGEGGTTPSRFKHVVQASDGRRADSRH